MSWDFDRGSRLWLPRKGQLCSFVFPSVGFFGGGPAPAITIQNSTSGSGSSVTSVAITIPGGGVPGGSLLLASSSCSGTSASTCTVTDSKSNTWVSVIAYNALGRSVFLSYCKNSIALVSGDTVTFTFNATANYSVSLEYATNMNTSAPYDVSSALGSSTGVTQVDSGTTASSAYANSLVYGFYRGNTLNVEATGYTGLITTASHHTAYKIVAATGTQKYDPTQTSSSYGAGVAVFKGL